FLNSDGTVKGHQKISDTEGNFTGTLDDSDRFGSSVANVGDLDADGVTDLAVGADGDDDGSAASGAVWMLFLNSDGTVKDHRKISSTEGLFTGSLYGDNFGCSVASVGDLDGDGGADLAVGARYDDDGGLSRGSVWMLFLAQESGDYGDAPDPDYPTLFASDGARHLVDLNGPFMGTFPDVEPDGQHDATATADDTDGNDDEDGLSNPQVDLALTVGAAPSVNVTVTNNTGVDATLYGWIDYNGDGTFDNATERASTVVPDGTSGGGATLNFPVAPWGSVTETYARFRFSTDAAASDPTGSASDGEVEDYAATIAYRSDGTVEGHQKISDTEGGFTGTLDNSDFFGHSVANVGDLDGDGVTDLAVGAYFDADGGSARGAVWMVFLAPEEDFGDAPTLAQSGFAASYPTTLADSGAQHDTVGPTLGANRDSEPDGQPDPNALGDDNAGTPDDEDGVRFDSFTLWASTATANTGASVEIDLQNADAASNRLDAWIDFNQDGDWADTGEQIFTNYELGTSNGTKSLSFTIPQDTGTNVELGNTYARFRLSTAGGLSPTGTASDGEVEDYKVTITSTITVSSVSAVAGTNNTVFDVSFAGQSAAGNYRIEIGPDILAAGSGPQMDQDGDASDGYTAYTRSFSISPGVDIRLESVTNFDNNDADGTVAVSYYVENSLGGSPFNLVVFSSTDPRLDLATDTQTGVFTVSAGGDLSVGSHIVNLPTSLFPDPDFTRNAELYSLVVIDPYWTDVADLNRSNNCGVLMGVTKTADGTLYVAGDPYAADTVTITNSSVTFANLNSGTPISYTAASINDIFVNTGPGDDTVTATGTDENILAMLGGGNDTYTGGDLIDAVLGGPGHDTLTGNSGNDRLYGMDGNDTVDGGAGNDTVSVGPGGLGGGIQSLSGGTGDDYLLIDGTEHNDRILVWDPDEDTGQVGTSLQAMVQSAAGNAPSGSVVNGPDDYGSVARKTAYQNIDLVPGGTGVTTVVNDHDWANYSINLGSNTFNYYGTSYTGTELYVSPNGFITFGSTFNIEQDNIDFASSGFTNRDLLAPYFDDLTTIGGSGASDSTVLTKIDGNQLIVEWSNVPHEAGGGAATFQAILELNTGSTPGDITFNYVDVDFGNASYDNGASATAGLQIVGSFIEFVNQLVYNGTGPASSILTDGSAFVFSTDVGYNAAVVQEIYISSVDAGDKLLVNASYGDDLVQLENTNVTGSKVGLDAILIGGPGGDTLYDGLGSDVLIGDSAYTTMTGDGTDLLYSSDDGEIDKLVGKVGTDTLSDGGAEDTIVDTDP
ncbi:MAG: FG-GAP repeat protein, partial [Planctomycetes bacterium]|nr:FG-GAP repeat protein [Planctomycetota bacterium]